MSNTIDSPLQLTEVLTSSMRALKRKLAPLLQLSTVYSDVALKGDGTMAVPYYPLTATGTSQTRTATGSRKALATGTTTNSKTISNFTNKMQALSFSATERARQPMFNPSMHGMLKGEALAYDVLADIFGVVRAADYSGSTIDAVTAANFDEDEVADLRKLCEEDYWPDSGRSLLVNPSYGANLLKQPQIIGANTRGDGGRTFREGVIGNILGFDIVETAGLRSNNGDAIACTGEADDNVITTASAHGLAVGDRIIFPALSGGSGLTAATVAYFVLTVPSTTTLTVSASAGGAVVNFTTDVTSGSTIRKFEDVQGLAILPSAILVGFAPVPPTPAIRKALFDYQELVDRDENGNGSGLVLQYYHFADPDTDEEIQTIECHYGFAIGDTAQAKIIRAPLA
jgi:hypothetical protein